MEKKFKMEKNHLEIVVTAGDKIWLPKEDGTKEFIGSFEQTTIQKIEKDKVAILKEFIEKELEKAKSQKETIAKQLEVLKDVTDIDNEVVQEAKKVIGKGTKIFKQKMLVLNNHIEQVQKKQQYTHQSEFIEKEFKRLSKELADLNKAIR